MRTLEARIDALVRRDRLLTVAFAVAMWVVLAFVCVVAVTTSPTPVVSVVLVAAAVVLGAFNTASVLAMIRRYRQSSRAVYGPDIEHLDRMHAARSRRRSAS